MFVTNSRLPMSVRCQGTALWWRAPQWQGLRAVQEWLVQERLVESTRVQVCCWKYSWTMQRMTVLRFWQKQLWDSRLAGGRCGDALWDKNLRLCRSESSGDRVTRCNTRQLCPCVDLHLRWKTPRVQFWTSRVSRFLISCSHTAERKWRKHSPAVWPGEWYHSSEVGATQSSDWSHCSSRSERYSGRTTPTTGCHLSFYWKSKKNTRRGFVQQQYLKQLLTRTLKDTRIVDKSHQKEFTGTGPAINVKQKCNNVRVHRRWKSGSCVVCGRTRNEVCAAALTSRRWAYRGCSRNTTKLWSAVVCHTVVIVDYEWTRNSMPPKQAKGTGETSCNIDSMFSGCQK